MFDATTNFNELVDLIVSCSAEDLRRFLESAGRNATYTSKVTVVEFVEVHGVWTEESLLKRLHKAPFYSLVADECADITTVEDLAIFSCCRVEVGHFLDIVLLKKADAKTIYSTLVDFLMQKNIQLSKLVGMGFDGATFSGKHNGVQSLLKKTHLMLYLYTATAIYFNLPALKLPTTLKELSVCTQHLLLFGNISTTHLNEQSV